MLAHIKIFTMVVFKKKRKNRDTKYIATKFTEILMTNNNYYLCKI